MTSFNGNTQIVDLYETSGLTPEQISEGLGLDTLAVKAVLSQSSARFRAACKEEDKTPADYTDDDEAEARRILLAIMRDSDDDRLRAKIAMRVRDDKKGRLEPQNTGNSIQNNLANLNINIQVLQQQLEAGRAALAQTHPGDSKLALEAKTIEIPEKEAKMLAEAQAKMRGVGKE